MKSLSNDFLLFVQIDGLPPSVNTSYRGKAGKFGRCVFYKKREVKQWQTDAKHRLVGSAKHLDLPLMGKLRLTIICYTKNERRMDVDNRIKAVQDCLQDAGIIKDDSQIWDVRALRKQKQGIEEYTLVLLADFLGPEVIIDGEKEELKTV